MSNKGPILRCSVCDVTCPPEVIRYTMFERSPQQYQGVTVAHLCAQHGRQALKVFAANLREMRKANAQGRVI